MSSCGSRIARRAIFAVALACIRTKRNGEALNPYLYEYYIKKESKPKMVALDAIMQKVTNIIIAVLRNNSAFELQSPKQHQISYRQQPMLMVHKHSGIARNNSAIIKQILILFIKCTLFMKTITK